jgi:hypothetical protein
MARYKRKRGDENMIKMMFELFPKQMLALKQSKSEVLYGGSAGGK